MKQVAFNESSTSLGLTVLVGFAVHEDDATGAVASFSFDDDATSTGSQVFIELAANESTSEAFGDGASVHGLKAASESGSWVLATGSGQYTGVVWGY